MEQNTYRFLKVSSIKEIVVFGIGETALRTNQCLSWKKKKIVLELGYFFDLKWNKLNTTILFEFLHQFLQ